MSFLQLLVCFDSSVEHGSFFLPVTKSLLLFLPLCLNTIQLFVFKKEIFKNQWNICSLFMMNRKRPSSGHPDHRNAIKCPGRNDQTQFNCLKHQSWIWVPTVSFRTVALFMIQKYFSNYKFQQKQQTSGRNLKTGTGVTFYCRLFSFSPYVMSVLQELNHSTLTFWGDFHIF